jgi:hypothetical protein
MDEIKKRFINQSRIGFCCNVINQNYPRSFQYLVSICQILIPFRQHLLIPSSIVLIVIEIQHFFNIFRTFYRIDIRSLSYKICMDYVYNKKGKIFEPIFELECY